MGCTEAMVEKVIHKGFLGGSPRRRLGQAVIEQNTAPAGQVEFAWDTENNAKSQTHNQVFLTSAGELQKRVLEKTGGRFIDSFSTYLLSSFSGPGLC